MTIDPIDKVLSITEMFSEDKNEESEVVYRKREVVLASLCVDILQMRMWSHRSFRTVFKHTLAKALYLEHGGLKGEESYIKELSEVSQGKMTYDRAKVVLSKYQWKLFHANDLPLKVHKDSA